jgi:kynurenine formamidase
MLSRHLALVVLAGACARGPAATPNGPLPRGRLVDLTHPFNDKTLYWPTSPSGFVRQVLSYGPTPAGFFYASGAFAAPEHGGTHLDAPIHFAAGKSTAEAIPLARLVAPAVIVDMSARAAADRDALLTPADLDAFERDHGAIAPGTIVLVRTGWGARWPDRKSYLGDDTPGDASHLHFPGIGGDAARELVRRQVAAVGIDTASIDCGPSTDFITHQVLMGADIPAFENVAELSALPPRGAFVIALPMKIDGGSGGPLRIIAIVP